MYHFVVKRLRVLTMLLLLLILSTAAYAWYSPFRLMVLVAMGHSPSFMNGQMDTIRKIVTIVVTLGAIASWLAMIGIFGLLAFTVAQRTCEIGVRIALGARGFDVSQCVLGQDALPFGIGAVLGVALAAAAAKVVRNLLFGFIPFSLVSFGAGLLLFGAVAFAASIAPVRRALRIDPASALRYE